MVGISERWFGVVVWAAGVVAFDGVVGEKGFIGHVVPFEELFCFGVAKLICSLHVSFLSFLVPFVWEAVLFVVMGVVLVFLMGGRMWALNAISWVCTLMTCA